jgi:hypothetical protein
MMHAAKVDLELRSEFELFIHLVTTEVNYILCVRLTLFLLWIQGHP